MKLAKFIILYMLSSLLSGFAYASCESASPQPAGYYIAKLDRITPPTFNPNSLQVGATIWSTYANITFVNPSPAPQSRCTEPWVPFLTGVGFLGGGGALAYQTSIPGIGLVIQSNGGNHWPFSLPANISANSWVPWTTWSLAPSTMTISLVKTGPISAGGVLTGVWGEITAGQGGPVLVQYVWSDPIIIKPQSPTCSVSTPAINVTMSPINKNNFNGVGSVAQQVPFEINLTCSGGAAGTATNAYITFTDSTNPGNTSNTLSLTGKSTASGVAVQILNKDKSLIAFGPDSSSFGNLNQWLAGSISVGQTSFSIPLSARYIQVAPSVKPGSVNAMATFTMSYI